MFRKLVSNVAFSPALVGQLGFYARRLRKEETTRRIGLIFTVLALVVQAFAVFTPPESANAANGNNIIYSGFSSKNELLSIYDRNQDSAGHKDLQQIYAQFGITRQDIVNGAWGTFNSRDFNNSITSIGRSASVGWQRDAYKIANTSSTVYGGKLSKFDSSSQGTNYTGVIGKRAIDGQWFAIMSGCGNAAFIKLPPPPVTPAAACSALTITPLSRTKYSFNAKATATNGATISGYTYVVKNTTGSIIISQKLISTAATNALTYDFAKDGSYTVSVVVSTSIGDRTSPDCQKSLTVAPQPPCTLNPTLPQNSPDCKPCENDHTVWYKDAKCHSEFLFTKSVRNVSQAISDANNTTSLPGDRLEYHLIVKNVGKTTGIYAVSDNLSDVLEYADLFDAGGGTLAKNDGVTPVEDVNTISWPAIEIKPGQTIEKIISVQVKSTIPSTPRSVGNQESYNCRMINSLGDSQTTVKVDCPAPKLVEQTVSELPHTGASENMIFAGIVLAIVVYFYARARQVKKEVRLIRRDLNAGTI